MDARAESAGRGEETARTCDAAYVCVCSFRCTEKTNFVISEDKVGGARAAPEPLSAPCVHKSRVLCPMDVLTPAQLVQRLAGRDNNLRIAVASDSESGKSTLVRELARALLAAGLVTVVCALTADVAGAQEQYGEVLTARCNLLWSEAELERILSARGERKELGKENPPTLVILDDLAGEKAGNSAAINTLYTRGRHFNLVPIFLNQVANVELSPKVRGNCNVFLFSSLTPGGVNILHDTFVLAPPMTKKELTEWVSDLPRYTFGVYDRIDKCLLRVKAEHRSGSGSESEGGRPRAGTGYDEKEAEREARRSARYGKLLEHAAVKEELERHKAVMSYFRGRAEKVVRLLEAEAEDDDIATSTVVEAAKTFGVILRSFNPDGSCAIPNDWTTPGVVERWVETQAELAERAHLLKLGRGRMTTSFAPNAGAGLSEDEALAAALGDASLEEL